MALCLPRSLKPLRLRENPKCQNSVHSSRIERRENQTQYPVLLIRLDVQVLLNMYRHILFQIGTSMNHVS